MMKTIYFFCLSSLLFMGIGCKKPENNQAEYVTVDSEVLQYMKLLVGSYYIYKDSATGITDSVVVTKSEIQKLFYPAHTAIMSSWPFAGTYTAHIPDTYYDSLTLQLTTISASGSKDWLLISHLQEKYNNAYFSTDSISSRSTGMTFWFPYFINSSSDVENNGVYAIPSMNIEGNTYRDVLLFVSTNANNPSTTNYKKSAYYWASGTGVIKRVITNSTGMITSTLVRKG